MMKNILVPVLALFSVLTMPAQSGGGTGTITISLISGQNPLTSAFVLLCRTGDSSTVQSGLTDASGKVEFSLLPYGSYFITVRQPGLKALTGPPMTIDEVHPVIIPAPVHIESTTLKEVVISDKTPFIEVQADRLVLNVANSSVNTGSNILEVLQRAPGVQVDQNEKISLKGKQNVVIMIDGKPTMLTGDDLANTLKAMPAGSVDKIELITNPSAKYDAAGNGGIINIKIRKEKRAGTNGTVTAGLGLGIYPLTADGFSINHRTVRYNVYANYNYTYRRGINHLVLYRSFYNGADFTGAYSQDNNLVIPIISHTARAGADFYLSEQTTLGVSFSGMSNQFNPNGVNNSDVLDSLGQKQSSFRTFNDTRDKSNNYSANLNLRHVIDTSGSEITGDLDFARYGRMGTQIFETDYYKLDQSLLRSPDILKGNTRGVLDIYSVKADYTHAMKHTGRLEAGIKSSYVKADNDLKYYSMQNNAMSYDSSKSNHFIYTENINAGYINFNRDFSRFKMQTGIRAEQTIATGNQLSTGQQFTFNYIQFFPSIAFHRNITSAQELGLSLSRRIDRPTYDQLNPFRFYLDPSTYKEGNPYLLAQNTWSAELSDVIKEKYILTLTASSTENAITTVLIPSITEKKVTVQIDENLSRFNYAGFSVSAPVRVLKWWNMLNNANAYYGQYKANLAQTPLNNGRFAWDVNSTSTFTFTEKFNADLQVSYNSAVLFGYLTIKPAWQINTGVQYKVLKSKGTLKLSMSDIFWTALTRGSTVLNGYTENFVVTRQTRVINLSFTYNFGSGVKGANRKTGGAEDEKRRAS